MNLVEMVTGGRPDEESEAWAEDADMRLLHGRVTQCRHANQCEGHAVYCMHDDGPRKCGRLWQDGCLNADPEMYADPCQLFEENEHWQGGRLPTFKHLLAKGLAHIEDAAPEDD